MRGREVLWRVELPNALPLIIGGVRSAVLQVISTATIAAYVGLGGLGRFIFDGLAQRDFPQMIGGSLLVALLAIVVDLLLAALQKIIVSPGLQAVPRSGPRRLRAVPHHPSRRRPCGLSPSSPRAGGTDHETLPDRPRPGRRGRREPRPHRLRGWRRPARRAGSGSGGGGGSSPHDRRRLGQLHREPDPGRDLRPGPAGQGRQRHQEAVHRQPRGLLPGPAGRLDRPHPRVHRRAAAVPQQVGHRDRARRRLRRAAEGAARHPHRAGEVQR